MQLSDSHHTLPFRASGVQSGSGCALPIINGLWIGQLSPLEQLCIKSFVAQGHPYHLYTYDVVENVPQGVTLQDAGQILPRAMIFRNQNGKGKGSLAGFSDLFRYKLLMDRGGWWVDTDVFCLKPFDFTAPYVFGAEDKPIASGVLKMPQCCQLAQRCYEQAANVDPATIVWNELVNILVAGVNDLGLMPYVIPARNFSPIVWRDIPDFVQGRKIFVPPADSYGVHLYNEMWRRHKLDKWSRYSASSVLNILRRHANIREDELATRPRSNIMYRSIKMLRRYLPARRAA